MELHAVFTDTGYHRIAGVSSNHRWEPSACTGESVSVISSHYVRRGKRAPIVHGCESELRGEISQVEPLYSVKNSMRRYIERIHDISRYVCGSA